MKKYKDEKKVQRLILDYIKKNTYNYKTIVNNRNGIPDIVGCHDGLFFSIEVKGENRSLKDITALQKKEMKSICDNNGIAMSVNNFDKFKILFDYFILNRFLM